MGLDSYLRKESYVKNWKHQTPEEKHTVVVLKGGFVRPDIKPERVSLITEQVGYWRKFNALHGWFVNECGLGVDECQRIDVSVHNLKKLLGLLKEVKELIGDSCLGLTEETIEKVMEIFPTMRGFFFGSTDIDEYYNLYIAETIDLLDDIIKEDEENTKNGLISEYHYRASW
jgi:hypothetical protein